MTESKIWLAGGCFWGIEEYLKRIDGVIHTTVGYANGKTDNTTYQDVKRTGHSETVEVIYNSEIVSLPILLEYFYAVIDPLSVNKQGNDVGEQYRSGIYYNDDNDFSIIKDSIQMLQNEYNYPVVIEVEKLRNFVVAEAYHQEYLRKNPNGYCHVNFKKIEEINKKKHRKRDEDLREKLTDMEYRVTQENATEPPFNNKYYANYKKGIYVDIVSGKPLFVSSMKFESGCGWPSFSKPINEEIIEYREDRSYNMSRVEVRSKSSNSHLGHVFKDGPKDKGGLRFCINSASLKFIPYDEMEGKGYKEFIKLID